MKKLIIVIGVIAFFSSCHKNKCYTISDCMGNDIQNYCGSKSEVEAYCASNSTPGCNWTYRPE